MTIRNALKPVLAAILSLPMIGLAPMSAAQLPQAVARVVNSHLDEALGSVEFRTVGRRQVNGASRVETRQAGRGSLVGTFTFDSHPDSMRLQVDFGANNYQGEMFEFDGNKSTIGFNQPALSRRSALGNFIAENEVIVREGLLGGVLNASWALLDVARRQPKIDSDGMKNFDARSNYRLSYRAKSHQGDLSIYLYFDSKSFRHRATVYTWSQAQNVGPTITTSSRQSDIYFQLVERFDDFQTIGKLTLPTSWSMEYTETANTAIFWRYMFKVSIVE